MADAPQKAKKTKKMRKYGRNKATCERYRREFRREKNKLRYLLKHVERFPDDHCATGAIGRLRQQLGILRAQTVQAA